MKTRAHLLFLETGCCLLLVLFTLPVLAQPANPYLELYKQFQQGTPLPAPAFKLHQPGKDLPVDFTEYGEFRGAGTNDFIFVFKDREGLAKVLPEGIYPNDNGVYEDPAYKKHLKGGKLAMNHWQALGLEDEQAAFLIWATAGEEAGVKTFFTAQILERAGHILPALQAYQTVFINFPRSVCWGPDGTFVWYPSQAALASMRRICREYPALGLWYEGGSISIQNGYDPDLSDDIIIVTPGKFIKRSLEERIAAVPDLQTMEIFQKRGKGQIRLVQFANGHWQLLKDDKPFFVRAVSYSPTRIGLGPKSDGGWFHMRWMHEDRDQNGQNDVAFDAWIDANRNNNQDKNEKAVGDFQILKEMGANAIRMYHAPDGEGNYDPSKFNKPLLRRMAKEYGIYLILGDFLGAYTVGSGASWEAGTDYTDQTQRERLKSIVRDMVLDLKDEPFILMYVLGNENNMRGDYTGVNATRTNAGKHPEAYASLLNEVAAMIHELDPNHPVAVGNIGTHLLDVYNTHAPELDILGLNAYRGKNGFASLWEDAARLMDRPVLITEYGCDAFHEGRGLDEAAQAEYLEGNHRDIVFNMAGGEFSGKAIGGIVFQYMDEWWKDTHSGDPEDAQETNATFRMPFPDGWSHEEWLGIIGQGSGEHSPYQRVPRKAYYYYKKVWN